MHFNDKNEKFDFILDGTPSQERVTVKLFSVYLPTWGGTWGSFCQSNGDVVEVGGCAAVLGEAGVGDDGRGGVVRAVR